MELQQKYPSKVIQQASQFELEQMLAKFKAEYISTPKFFGFVAYNFVALSGLVGVTAWYVKSRWIKKGQKGKLKKKQLTIGNLIKKGSKVGLLLGSLYMGGFFLYVNYMMPLSVFKKYTEIQEAFHVFQIKYDPFFQDLMLFRKMRRFGLSQNLISEIRADLNEQKDQLIAKKKLKQETIQKIRKSQQIYKTGIYQTKNLIK